MEQYIVYVSLGLALLSLILLFIQNIKLKGMIRKYNNFMQGLGDKDVEKLMTSYMNELNSLKREVHIDMDQRVRSIEIKLPHCVQNVGIVNYNAFKDVSNEMSFSAALMDENKNGFILTGIYSRDHSYVYSKEIREGKPQRELSREEVDAMNKAQNKLR